MANKPLKKIMAGMLLFMAIILASPVAFALPGCSDLNADDKNPNGTKGWIVTILEEQIGAPTKQNTADAEKNLSSATEGIIDCLRVTTTGSNTTTGSQELKSTYKDLGACPGNAVCQRVQVFFSKSGTGLLFTYIGLVYRWAAGVIGTVSVLFLVWGGVEIATAGDNTSKIDEAKTRIMQSLGGLALLFLSAVILYTINPNFFTI